MKYTHTIDVPEGWIDESVVDGLLEPSGQDRETFEEWADLNLLMFVNGNVSVSAGWCGEGMDDGSYSAIVFIEGTDHPQWDGVIRSICSRSSYEIKKFVEQAMRDYR